MLASSRLPAPSFTLRAAPLIFALALPIGCAPSTGGPTPGEDGGTPGTDGGDVNTGPCPAGQGGSFSVCQVQHPDAPNRPSQGAEVTIRGVVALSDVFDLNAGGTIKAIFVSDVPLKEYGGIMVTFTAEDGFAANAGDLVDVTGTFSPFSDGAAGSEERIQASFLQATGGTADITPLAVNDPSILADESLGEPYEGMLVRVQDVSVTNAALGFGQWEVTGGLIADDTIYAYNPLEGEVLGTLIGVMGYNAFTDGGFRILPRSADDVVSVSKPSVTLASLRDPADPAYSEPCQSGSFDCSPVLLNRVVVTSHAYQVSDSGLYGFFVADPEAVDGEGRLLPYSGIFVTITPSRDDTTSDYSFAVDGDGNFVSADAAPQVGDVVNVMGRNGIYFGMPQLYFSNLLQKVGTVASEGITMPEPAQFDGALDAGDARHPSRLKAGRPAVTTAGFERDAIAAGDAVDEWVGVPVELINVETTSACVDSFVADPNRWQDFGYWQVTGDVEIGTLFDRTFGGYWSGVPFDGARTCNDAETTGKCEDSRAVGQEFDSLTGILNVSFDVYRVNPLTTDDIQPPSLFAVEGSGTCSSGT